MDEVLQTFVVLVARVVRQHLIERYAQFAQLAAERRAVQAEDLRGLNLVEIGLLENHGKQGAFDHLDDLLVKALFAVVEGIA